MSINPKQKGSFVLPVEILLFKETIIFIVLLKKHVYNLLHKRLSPSHKCRQIYRFFFKYKIKTSFFLSGWCFFWEQGGRERVKKKQLPGSAKAPAQCHQVKP
jgi:hypothetical protein